MRTLSAVLLMCGSMCLSHLETCCGWGTWGCSPSVEPGIDVYVADAESDYPIDHAVLTLTEGGYAETLMRLGWPPGAYSGADERPGTYTLTVEADSYVSQTFEEIVIGMTEDGCHVATVSLTVKLTLAH